MWLVWNVYGLSWHGTGMGKVDGDLPLIGERLRQALGTGSLSWGLQWRPGLLTPAPGPTQWAITPGPLCRLTLSHCLLRLKVRQQDSQTSEMCTAVSPGQKRATHGQEKAISPSLGGELARKPCETETLTPGVLEDSQHQHGPPASFTRTLPPPGFQATKLQVLLLMWADLYES